MLPPDHEQESWLGNTRRGNVWSGVVALVLLGMFTLALVSSELAATGASMERAGLPAVIAGQ